MKMTPYHDQNYYEILEIQPDASPFEIQRAFEETFELYQSDSSVSYSFFPEDERKEILRCLEEAYLHLIHADSRTAYDRSLIEKGLMEEGKQFQNRSKAPIPLYQYMTRHIGGSPSSPHASLDQPDNSALPIVEELLEKGALSGRDLRSIRVAIGVSLEMIEKESKIKISMLKAIEEDDYERFPPLAYLKGFIKLYARCLQLDDDRIVNAYLRHMKL